jgi:hypothetical protein
VILFLCWERDLIYFEYLKHAPLYLRELSVALAEASQSDQLLGPLIEDFDHLSGGHDHPTGQSQCLIMLELIFLQAHL